MTKIHKAACIGGGVIGGAWAARFVLAGIDTKMYDPHPEAERIVGEVMANAERAYGLLTMAPLPQADLPAGKTVAFAPGGKHVMLFDLDPATAPGGQVRLHFTFADGRTIDAAFPAVAANAPVPEN